NDGLQHVAMDVVTSGQEGHTVWRSTVIISNQLGVFARWPMGGVHDWRSCLCATVSEYWRAIPDLRQCGSSALVTRRKGTLFLPISEAVLFGQHHDPAKFHIQDSHASGERSAAAGRARPEELRRHT